jgi:hypothetical protein
MENTKKVREVTLDLTHLQNKDQAFAYYHEELKKNADFQEVLKEALGMLDPVERARLRAILPKY